MRKLRTDVFLGLFLGGLVLFGVTRVVYGQGLFDRNLRLGDWGEDVRRLQVFLNTYGTPVAKAGHGSVGQETNFFGPKTREAVTAFQELHRTSILTPIGLAQGTGTFYTATREVINNLVQQTQDQATSPTAPSVQDPTSTNLAQQPTYLLGGTVTGITQPLQIREASGETLTIKPGESASFVFSKKFAPGEHYQVTAISSTAGSPSCYVSDNGTGVVADASVLSIQIQCTSESVGNPFQITAGYGAESYVLAGTVSGLTGTVVLETSTGDRLALTTNGAFVFGSRVLNGSSYQVSVRTNPSGPDQTCTVTNGSGTMRGANVANIDVTCVANLTTLTASVNTLALSVTGLADAPSSGSPRRITITNTGSTVARDLVVSSPTWPAGTISATTCSGALSASASCTITVTPGATASSDGTSPCSTGSAPVPGVVQVNADNSNTVSTNVVILSYGCVYQDGYIFSIDDTTPVTQSVGGTVAALENQSNGMVWSSNGADASTVSYDVIPGIGETSVSVSSAPTFSDLSTYFGSTYTGILGLISGDFSACKGNTDGRCNTSSIVHFYDHYRTNYGIGSPPYTPTVTPTPKSYYAAGVCDDYDSGDYQDWYLPAICQVTVDYPDDRPETASCGVEDAPLMQTMMKNLFYRGIGDFTIAQGIWSSSLYMYNNPETYAWSALVWPSAFPGGGDKADLSQVRCVRSLTP